MAKRKITLNVPADLLDNLKEFGVKDPIAFLEDFFAEMDAEDFVAMMEEEDDEYWDEEEDYEDEEF
ncbi:MAG: hypothetical protein HPY64_00960 [Anaerolineae bacterium]|nr:hypothetical protein [Anaerolineae bacterium]